MIHHKPSGQHTLDNVTFHNRNALSGIIETHMQFHIHSHIFYVQIMLRQNWVHSKAPVGGLVYETKSPKGEAF